MSSTGEKTELYYTVKNELTELLKAVGSISDLKMSITYVSLGENTNVKHYFLFCPYITGMEKVWEENKTKPWDTHYNFATSEYKNLNENVFIKDDFLNVPVELYEHFYRTKDFSMYEYKNKQLLANPLDVHLHVEDYYNKYEMEFNIKSIKIVFPSPMKEYLPFPTKSIQLEYPSQSTNFFKLSFTNEHHSNTQTRSKVLRN